MFSLVTASKSIKFVLITGVAVAAAALGGCNNDAKVENEALKSQLAQVQQERDSNKQLLDQSEAQKAELRNQVDELTRAKSAQPPVLSDTGGGTGGGKSPRPAARETVIEVAGDVLFAPGQTSLSAAGKKELDKVASRLKKEFPKNQIRVEGYTDSDPVRKNPLGSNEAISKARAIAVEKYLASKGVSASRMTAVGRGSANPKATKAASRRVEIHVLGG